MKSYLLAATGVIFLSVIVSLIAPEGKMKKMVTFVIRLICIFVLITPLSGIFKKGIDEAGAGGEVDYTFIEGIYSDHQSEQLENLLNEKFSVQTDCLVTVGFDGVDFNIDSVKVEIIDDYDKFYPQIYEYLQELGYINITVYAQGT